MPTLKKIVQNFYTLTGSDIRIIKLPYKTQNPGKRDRSAMPVGRSAIFLSRASLFFLILSSSCRWVRPQTIFFRTTSNTTNKLQK